VAVSLNNLAVVEVRLGEYLAACDLSKRALKIDETAFGMSHPQVLPTLQLCEERANA